MLKGIHPSTVTASFFNVSSSDLKQYSQNIKVAGAVLVGLVFLAQLDPKMVANFTMQTIEGLMLAPENCRNPQGYDDCLDDGEPQWYCNDVYCKR